MNIFCAHQFTGEDLADVTKRMWLVVDALTKAGHQAYCPLFDPKKQSLQASNSIKEIFDLAFQNIAKSDALVAIVSSERKSEGMLIEVGACLSQNKPVFLFINSSFKNEATHLTKLSTSYRYWDSLDELQDLLTKT